MGGMTMTALDFRARGVVIKSTWDGLRVHGPKGDTQLAEQLRAEVARRMPIMETVPPSLPRGAERCDGCGDPMARGCGGWCDLCCLARQKVVRARRAEAAR